MRKLTKEEIQSGNMFSEPFNYDGLFTIHPVKMKDYMIFQYLKESIILRKNSIFRQKNILKMSYLDFVIYADENEELESQYKIPELHRYYKNVLMLLLLVCPDDKVGVTEDKHIYINDTKLTGEMFDNIRRIIIAQNDIDFDIDEFVHRKTQEALASARRKMAELDKENANIEDYIDYFCVAMRYNEQDVKELTIRKFWRLIRAITKSDIYKTVKPAEFNGFAKVTKPMDYWMNGSLNKGDSNSDIKTTSEEIQKYQG